LPPEIGNLKNLEELHLQTNKLTSLPPEIGNLQSLRVLNLSNNKLTCLSLETDKLQCLESLEELHLAGNELKSLPPEIGNLKSLRILNLSNNKLTRLPPEIDKLQDLQSLDISNNPIKKVSSSWRAVKRELKSDKRNLLEYGEYKAICSIKGVLNAQPNTLIQFLQDQEFLYHFQQDEYLKDIVFINLKWIVEAFSKILNAEAPKKRGGILMYSDLEEIWKGEDGYKFQERTPLLKLLKYCKKIIFLQDEPETYLVPELLPEFLAAKNQSVPICLIMKD